MTAGDGLNLTQAKALNQNADVIVRGCEKGGSFEIPGDLARQWLNQPNPNGKPNTDVVRPWVNGKDITARSSDTWIIDFGVNMPEQEAALYESPFAYVLQHVKLERQKNREERTGSKWWLHRRSGEELRAAIAPLNRYIVTPRVSKYRLFVWCLKPIFPDSATFVITRSDDTAFGILHSRFHELWSLGLCTWLGVGNDPRYTPTTTFETFPFPEGLTPNLAPANYNNPAAAEITTAAQELNKLRDNWLNPTEWTDWVRTEEEEKAGYPLRPVAKSGHDADLKNRTLTNLYNARPAWLDNAHKTLDAVVAKAYGWNDYTPKMPDEEILRRLLVLNLACAK